MSGLVEVFNQTALQNIFNKTRFLGKKFFLKQCVDSTNEEALRLLKDDLNRLLHGTIIVSLEQTMGRGTKGSFWYSPPEMGIYSSIILFPNDLYRAQDLVELPSVIGKKIALALEPKIRRESFISVKLPNDVLIDNKKVIGVLCESSTSDQKVNYIVIGFGMNLFRPKFKMLKALEGKIGFLNDFVEKMSSFEIYKSVIQALDELIYFFPCDVTFKKGT